MSNPGGVDDSPSFPLSDISSLLGEQVATLIEHIAFQAQEKDLSLYLAGGMVRDLILRQRSLDLDFVVEGDAISFANTLAQASGGSVQAHKPFGSAKWILDAAAAAKLSLATDAIPPPVDFASARRETYAHPAALPTISPSDIGRDLLRRDFSVNALAIQLSPAARSGDLLDGCGGGADLRLGLIRALHPKSFVDDPTRILRAARYALRLEFEIEAHTAQWMRAALPLLGRVSGQRLRNEFDLILRQRRAGDMMLRLQELGALAQIHPAFRVSPHLPELIARCNELTPPWPRGGSDRQTLRWIALFAGIDADEAQSLCVGLALTNALTQSITASARLAKHIGLLEDAALRPSQITKILDDFPDTALQAAWLLAAESPDAQERIGSYASDWRERLPLTTGHDLKAMGIAPGPRYRRILDRLRYAWIDGDARSLAEERALLRQLLNADD